MNDQSSAADFTQASRVLRLSSPLGDHILLPERARITEGVNRLFEIDIAVRSKQDIAAAGIIGKLVDVELEVQQGGEGGTVYRCWNGLVTELHEGPAVTRGLRSYHLVLRPSLWLLTQTRDSRTWMDQTTLDVLDTLMQEHGLRLAEVGRVISPKQIHYSCQFNESDLRYLFRRFEQDGYFWWFSHQKGAHTLHVANHASGWLGPSEAAKGEGKVRLTRGSASQNHIHEWTRRFSYVPRTRAGADWNYQTFGSIPLNITPSLVDLPGDREREVFEWPARAMDHKEAEQVEKLRLQSSEADHERVTGSSTVRILEPGRRFTPYDVANPDARYEEHVIVSAEHIIVDRSYETDSDSEPEYRNSFEAIPSRIPLTPHRTTPRPQIAGLQVAVVAGPEGEEIHCDTDGCVKLWFPWQRHRAKKDGSDTKWIRTAQNWAGSGWGGQIIPRVGMEVMVAFIDGDPDRPLVIGAVPNPINRVPYELPVNKTKSVFRTQTHKGTGFNEISFEDRVGEENFFQHAQKDMTQKVLNNDVLRVDRSAIQSLGDHYHLEIGANMNHLVGRGMKLVVGEFGTAQTSPLASARATLQKQNAALLEQALGMAARDAAKKTEPAGSKVGKASAAALGEQSLSAGEDQAFSSTSETPEHLDPARYAAFLGLNSPASSFGYAASNSADNDFRVNGGQGLAAAGSQLAAAAELASAFGVRNTQIAVMDILSVGAVSTEQVGCVKIASVGQVSMENVGHTKKLTVQEEYTIEVGKSLMVMKKDGTIILKGVKFYFEAEGPYQMRGGVIDSN